MGNISKLPKLGNITVPVHLMQYHKDGSKSLDKDFFQSGFAYFAISDDQCDVEVDGKDIATLGSCMGGHYQIRQKENSLSVIISVEDIWNEFQKLAESVGAKLVLEGIDEVYKKYWSEHQQEKEANLKYKEQLKEIKQMQKESEEAAALKIKAAEETVEQPCEKQVENVITLDAVKYDIGKTKIIEDGGWDLTKDLNMRDIDYIEDNIKIPVIMGCGVKVMNDRGIQLWTPDKNDNLDVELDIHTWEGLSPGAVHYYGKLKFNIPWLRYMDDERELSTSNFDLKLLGFGYVELTRKLEEWEKREDPERWKGWSVGSSTVGFYIEEEVKQRALEVFNQIFSEGWKLKLEDEEEFKEENYEDE